MLACRDAKRLELLSMPGVDGLVFTSIEGDFDLNTGGPGINPTLNLC